MTQPDWFDPQSWRLGIDLPTEATAAGALFFET